MRTFYVTCISDQHVQALKQFFYMYHDDVRWRFRIGILTVPSKDGSLPGELFDIDNSIPVLLALLQIISSNSLFSSKREFASTSKLFPL